MEDSSILELYNRRSQEAISATAAKYGSYCRAVADRILSSPQDTEEILNDTWLAAWNDIPPSQPQCLRAYLGRLTRNLSLSRYRFLHTQKRWASMETLLSELGDCLPAPGGPQEALEAKALAELLAAWVQSLEPEERQLFVRRYWHAVPVKQLAREAGVAQNTVAQRLLRLRRRLRARLEQEGVEL